MIVLNVFPVRPRGQAHISPEQDKGWKFNSWTNEILPAHRFSTAWRVNNLAVWVWRRCAACCDSAAFGSMELTSALSKTRVENSINSELRCAETSVGRIRILVAKYVKQQCCFKISIMRSSTRNGVLLSQASLPTKLGATRLREEFHQHLVMNLPRVWPGSWFNHFGTKWSSPVMYIVPSLLDAFLSPMSSWWLFCDPAFPIVISIKCILRQCTSTDCLGWRGQFCECCGSFDKCLAGSVWMSSGTWFHLSLWGC